ncbi:hypothetical protein MXD61_18420 [Frankia sp. AgPm24]|nr:hypothetical protein [Frankia sp. AgPm24]MCK9923817.1 hypothetical protein [Frankia sp. AgPm24]
MEVPHRRLVPYRPGHRRTVVAPEILTVADRVAWRSWLDANEDVSDDVWLVLAKKGTTSPASLRYDLALEEALCSGWIDGQKKSRDAATFQIRFTPCRKASLWSQRNTTLAARLIDEGRMRPRGRAEVERAQAGGRWDRAYPGAADAQIRRPGRRAGGIHHGQRRICRPDRAPIATPTCTAG